MQDGDRNRDWGRNKDEESKEHIYGFLRKVLKNVIGHCCSQVIVQKCPMAILMCVETNKYGLYSGPLWDRLTIPWPQRKRAADTGEHTVPSVCKVPVPLHQFFYDVYFFLSWLPKLFFYNSCRKVYHQWFSKFYEEQLSPKSFILPQFCSNYF